MKILTFFAEIDKSTEIHTDSQGIPKSQNNFKQDKNNFKQDKVGGLSPPDFKT